jgi:hypothetical protein
MFALFWAGRAWRTILPVFAKGFRPFANERRLQAQIKRKRWTADARQHTTDQLAWLARVGLRATSNASRPSTITARL